MSDEYSEELMRMAKFIAIDRERKEKAWKQLPTSIRNKLEELAQEKLTYSCDNIGEIMMEEVFKFLATFTSDPGEYLQSIYDFLDDMEAFMDEVREAPVLDPDNW